MNRGHKDFQSSALPTELSRLGEKKGRNKTSEARMVNGKGYLLPITVAVAFGSRGEMGSVEMGGGGCLGLWDPSGHLSVSLW